MLEFFISVGNIGGQLLILVSDSIESYVRISGQGSLHSTSHNFSFSLTFSSNKWLDNIKFHSICVSEIYLERANNFI